MLWTWPPYLREGRTRLEATLTMADATSHPRPLAKARHAAGNVAHWQGDTAAAEAFFAAALAGWRTVGDELNIAAALRSLASLAMERGDLDRAEVLLLESRPLFARLGHAQGQGFVAMTLGFVASARGDHRAALRLHEASLAAWASVPGEGYTADALANIGWERLLLWEPEAARPPYVRALAHARAHGDERGYATAVEGAAGITAIEGDHALAARLFAAAAAIREAIGVPLRSTVQEQLDGLIGRTRSALGEVTFWLEWEAGRVLPVPEALDLAAALLEPGLGAGRDPWSLTRRERDVLRLLAQGRSDKEIAAALFVERRTASKHVSAILAKLGVPSRAAAVALAFKHGLA